MKFFKWKNPGQEKWGRVFPIITPVPYWTPKEAKRYESIDDESGKDGIMDPLVDYIQEQDEAVSTLVALNPGLTGEESQDVEMREA